LLFCESAMCHFPSLTLGVNVQIPTVLLRRPLFIRFQSGCWMRSSRPSGTLLVLQIALCHCQITIRPSTTSRCSWPVKVVCISHRVSTPCQPQYCLPVWLSWLLVVRPAWASALGIPLGLCGALLQWHSMSVHPTWGGVMSQPVRMICMHLWGLQGTVAAHSLGQLVQLWGLNHLYRYPVALCAEHAG